MDAQNYKTLFPKCFDFRKKRHKIVNFYFLFIEQKMLKEIMQLLKFEIEDGRYEGS